jgi:uncharacterized protein (TIGR01244 family)
MRRLFFLLATGAMLAACAVEKDTDSQTGVYVDVASVSAGADLRPVDGLTAAGQPDAAALRAFADAGYVAVVDMRMPEEDRGMADERGVVETLGLDYVAFPISGADDINFDMARQLDGLLESFEGPVLVHCASSNRVGALLALREHMHGAGEEAAVAYGKGAGLTRLEPRVREIFDGK